MGKLHVPEVEADGFRYYGKWAGLPRGVKENLTRCVAQVAVTDGRVTHFHQCQRKRGKGPEGLYCAVHRPPTDTEARVLYRVAVDWHDGEIKAVKVDKANDSHVWIAGYREGRATKYWEYHDTFEQAKASLLRRLHQHRASAAERVTYFDRLLDTVAATEAS